MSFNPKKSLIADPYDLAALNATLAGTIFAGRLRYVPVTESTNALALEAAGGNAAKGGAESGTVYFADAQTAGRGRGGHQWHSPVGDGLYVSTLMRPRLAAGRALLLSLGTGLAAQAAVEEVTGFRLDIRWPNDLMLGRKKIGGILVETAVESGDKSSGLLRHAVIGIGINVNQPAMPAELKEIASSLRIESGRTWVRQEILAALLRALAAEVTALETSQDASELLKRFAAASSWVAGKSVRVDDTGANAGGGYTGITAGLSAVGLLQVRTATGMRTVVSGGVREL